MNNVYITGQGDQLINPSNYNNSIRLYLEEEKKIYTNLLKRYDVIIEAGCMTGRYLNEVIGFKRKYLGIDLVERYIEDGKNIHYDSIESKQAHFICDNISNIKRILHANAVTHYGNKLVIFPFNSFGNISNVEETIEALSIAEVDFAISTYTNDPITLDIRKDYYANSGFPQAGIEFLFQGVKFSSADGLSSIAYHESWLVDAFHKHNIFIESKIFAEIGIMYTNFRDI